MTMPKRSRIRCILKWAGFLACVLILLTWAVALHWRIIWVDKTVGFLVGEVYLSQLLGGGWQLDKYHELNWWPKVYMWTSAWTIQFRLWIPFAVIATPTGFLFWRDRRRVPPGYCQKCGYNLTANTSGICPECGKPCESNTNP